MSSGNNPYPYGTTPSSGGGSFAPPGAEAPLPWQTEPAPPAKKSGRGCLGCLLGCLGVSVVLAIVAAIGIWWFVQKIPEMARQVIDQAVQQSDLSPEDKQVVMQQVDRFVEGYKEGKVDMQKLGLFFEQLAESPLMDLMIAYAAKEKYINPSGLSAEEKQQAERTLQRLTRGVIEEKISKSELDIALDHISTDNGNGGREFNETLSDEQLRAFLAECQRLVEQAEIPDEEFQVDIGAELKKLVDQALGEAPPIQPEAPQ